MLVAVLRLAAGKRAEHVSAQLPVSWVKAIVSERTVRKLTDTLKDNSASDGQIIGGSKSKEHGD